MGIARHPIDAYSDLNLAAAAAAQANLNDPIDWSSYISTPPAIPTTASATATNMVPHGAIPLPPPSLSMAARASPQVALANPSTTSSTVQQQQQQIQQPQQTTQPQQIQQPQQTTQPQRPNPPRRSSSSVSTASATGAAAAAAAAHIMRPWSAQLRSASINLERQASGTSLKRSSRMTESSTGVVTSANARSILERERERDELDEFAEKRRGSIGAMSPEGGVNMIHSPSFSERLPASAGGVGARGAMSSANGEIKERSEMGTGATGIPTPKLSIPGPYGSRVGGTSGLHSPTGSSSSNPGLHQQLHSRPYPPPPHSHLQQYGSPSSTMSSNYGGSSRLGVAGLGSGGMEGDGLVPLPPSLWMSPSNPGVAMNNSNGAAGGGGGHFNPSMMPPPSPVQHQHQQQQQTFFSLPRPSSASSASHAKEGSGSAGTTLSGGQYSEQTASYQLPAQQQHYQNQAHPHSYQQHQQGGYVLQAPQFQQMQPHHQMTPQPLSPNSLTSASPGLTSLMTSTSSGMVFVMRSFE
ncbi:hypothetical protein CPB86DRAFT_602523 [Serendipita vermifera]|nr:hypothetical protein CPB86DRAFT_602523 [Serendipita vermifera]